MTSRPRPFAQVDVFSAEPYLGNPVAVVLDGTDLSDEQMARFARWTNLSETTFVLPPTTPEADYRLRIWTPSGELPFAGHPTLGSARAWLAAGNAPHSGDVLVQECAPGLVRIHRSPAATPSSVSEASAASSAPGSTWNDDAAPLAFEAPPTVRTGPLEDDVLLAITTGLGISEADVVAQQWVDNGPGWAAVLLRSDREVLDLEPEFPALGEHKVGVLGPVLREAAQDDSAGSVGSPDSGSFPLAFHSGESGALPSGSLTAADPAHGTEDHSFEVRAFVPGPRGYEDPVTGSLNASLAQWLIRTGRAPSDYVARQGTRLGRRGLVTVTSSGADVLVGGRCTVCVTGSVLL